MSPSLLFALMLAASLWAPRLAHAATVVLVRAARPSAVTTEATVRLRGELVSAGFDVRVIDPPAGMDVRASLEEAAAAPDVEAVVAIVAGWADSSESRVPHSAELWVIDRVTGKTVVRRVPYQPASSRAAEVLSIRALELLRASFLEVALAAERTGTSNIVAEPPPGEVTRWTDAALSEAVENRWPATWAIEVGGCVLGSMQGMTSSLMPLARVQRAFSDHLLGRITVAALGTANQVSERLTVTEVARAEVTQQFGLIEGARRWRTDHIFQPFISVGVGALHLAATGQTRATYEGVSDSLWAVIADVGLGVHVALRKRFEVAFELHAQLAQPYPVIRFFNREVAREGRPTLMGSLTLLAWM